MVKFRSAEDFAGKLSLFRGGEHDLAGLASAPGAQAVRILDEKIVEQGKTPQYLHFSVNWRK
jgi:hypothetical protein